MSDDYESETDQWRDLMPIPIETQIWISLITRPVIGVALMALPIAVLGFAFIVVFPLDPMMAKWPLWIRFLMAWISAFIAMSLYVRRPY